MGAFILSGSICETLFATPFTTPFLHIYGKYDVVVIEEESKRVIDLNNASSKRVESHPGGMHLLLDLCVITYSGTAYILYRTVVYLVLHLTNLVFAGHFVPNSQRWRQFFVDYIKTGFANPGCVSSPSAPSGVLDAVFAESDVTNAATPY